MGSALSSNEDTSAATISDVKSTKEPGPTPTNNGNQQRQQEETHNDNELPLQTKSWSIEAPILLDDDDDDDSDANASSSSPFPTPTGKEYDLIDSIAAELPSIIDEESNEQVQDYIQACDKGRGPMVACFSTAEYLSLFLRKHQEAETLYRNTCFRPASDSSANGVPVGKGRAYPPACFNLAQMRMTGKGGTKFDRKDGYSLFERGCLAGHGGSCHMQAKMLTSYPGSMGEGIPYNPRKAADLFDKVCEEGDSLSCFTLATMLLRGNEVNNEADNVMPNEARGLVPIKQRTNEADRVKQKDDARVALNRDPKRAESILQMSCNERQHAPSCYNLAVMYTQGDDGVEKDESKAEMYKKKTEDFVDKFGGFGFGGSMG